MEWWQELADRHGQHLTWRTALENFARAPLPEAQARILAEKCRIPEQVDLLADLFRETPRETESPRDRAHLFLSVVDESPNPLTDWIDGLYRFYGWLARNGRDTSFGMALGYLQCCSDAIVNTPFIALGDAVDTMLAEHGYAG